jgi:hypothetical protein
LRSEPPTGLAEGVVHRHRTGRCDGQGYCASNGRLRPTENYSRLPFSPPHWPGLEAVAAEALKPRPDRGADRRADSLVAGLWPATYERSLSSISHA